MHRAIILPFLLAPLGAVETEVADLRLGVGAGPLPTERAGVWTNVVPPSPPYTDNAAYREKYDNSPGLSLTLGATFGTLAPAGWLWGLQFRHISGSLTLKSYQVNTTFLSAEDLRQLSGDHSLPAIQYAQNGLAVTGGGGLALSPQWHLELVGIAGFDWVELNGIANHAGPVVTQAEGRGFGTTYGGRLGLYWTDESCWQLGFESEWTNTHGKVRADYINASTESTFNNSGFSARASVGYRF